MRYLYLVFLLYVSSLSAQQAPFYSQFFYNKLLSNPGAAGSTGLPCLTAFHRQQWVGLEGAPTTKAFSFNTPVLADRVGLGLTLVNDRIGFFNATYVQAAYAYRVAIANGNLGIGLHGSMTRYEAALSEIRILSGSATSQAALMDLSHLFNVGMGFHYENERFFLGASIPYVLDREQSNGQVRHVFANVGWVTALSPNVKMRAAAASRLVENAPPSFDAHLGFGFSEASRIWLGSTLRFSSSASGLGGDALVGVAQYQLNNRFRAGLSYDASLGALRRFNAGSFELMLEYSFVKSAPLETVLRPRYF